MKFTKATAQTLHAIRRARERYSGTLGLVDIIAIKDLITGVDGGFDATKVIFVARQSSRVSVWKVLYKTQWFGVIYDVKRDTIVKVLPQGQVDNHIRHSF